MTVIKEWNTTSHAWETILVGEPGETGATGPVGATGPTGPQGPQGTGVQLRGAYFGTSTPLPTASAIGETWVLGPPLPTAAPNRLDGSAKQSGDGMMWDVTLAWVNVGPLRGPQGIPGAGLTVGGYIEIPTEQSSTPAAPAANGCHLYLIDNGSGKTRLMAQFATGSPIQLAIQP